MCWDGSSAERLLRTEALENIESEAEFVAVHSPIRGFQIGGTRAADVSDLTEIGLLAALRQRTESYRHAFCVIEGEPGSGKSHLIRLFRVLWRQPNDRVLLIQRDDGSLRRTLVQLKAELGSEFEELFQGLGQTQDASLLGRAWEFQSALADRMRQGWAKTPLPDEAWCEANKLYSILVHDEVKKRWEAPKRILEIIDGAGGTRDSRLAAFSLRDAAKLSKLSRSLGDGIPPQAVRFLRKLARESSAIFEVADTVSDEKLTEVLEGRAPQSQRFVDALNSRQDSAVRQFLGISADGLRDLFSRLRRELKKRNPDQRLVLLLEDVTAFQGVDEQLIDALVTQSSTQERGDLCDLISVVGITPAYHRRVVQLGTYEPRITHHVRLVAAEGSDERSVSALRTNAERMHFVARYLQAIRAGSDRLRRSYERDKPFEPVWNRCERGGPEGSPCPWRDSCHKSFGAVELVVADAPPQRVGLYPLTEDAVNRIFEALRDPTGQNVLQTPRGMIQGVLSPTLCHPENIEAGRYPPASLETTYLPSAPPKGVRDRAVRERTPDFERVLRLMNWWGNGEFEVGTNADEPTLAQIPRGVYKAFGLDWIGKDAPVAPPVTPDPVTRPVTPDPVAPPVTPDPVTRPVTPSPRPKSPRGSSRSRLTRKQLAKRVGEISTWHERSQKLKDERFWHGVLLEELLALDSTAHEVPTRIWEKLVTENTVKLEGQGKTDKRHVVVPREEWVASGLEAALSLRCRESVPANTVALSAGSAG